VKDGGHPGQGLPDVVPEFIDDHGQPKQGRAALGDEIGCRPTLTAPLDPVVDEEHAVTRPKPVLHPEPVAVPAVVRLRQGRNLGSGKQAAVLTDRDEPGAQPDRAGPAEEKAASLDADDMGHPRSYPRSR